MKDPFPIPPPEWLVALVKPLADRLALASLPLHAHEVLFAFALYTAVHCLASPLLSAHFFPRKYAALDSRTRINWHVHVVSFFQALLISALSLYVIFCDEQRLLARPRARWEERIWEYSGVGGLCQSFALGYFLWDFIMCAWHVDIFGWGMLAHAVSALSVFALGYRPFVYFYAPVFLLYELSSPFLNIHWFCDKLDLTGSIYQAINGALLTATFFACRLVWGNIASFCAFSDLFHAAYYGQTNLHAGINTGAPKNYSTQDLLRIYHDEEGQRLAFAGGQTVPVWLSLVYLAANLTLNSLNIFWFKKMVATIRKRFDPPLGTKGVRNDEIVATESKDSLAQAASRLANDDAELHRQGKGSVRLAREKAEAAMNGSVRVDEEGMRVQRAVLPDGSKSLEIEGSKTLRTRRKA